MKKAALLKPHIFSAGFLLLLLCFCNIARAEDGSAATQEKPKTPYVSGEILVKFKEGADPTQVLKEINIDANGIERAHSIKPVVAKFKKEYKLEKDKDGWFWFVGKNYKQAKDISDEELFKEASKDLDPERKALYRSYKITLPAGISVEEAAAKLKADPNIERATPNYIRQAFGVPNDPKYSQQWALPKINAPAAWDITSGDPNVIIAIVDTGVDYNHEDLANNIWINPAEDINHNGKFDNWPSTEVRNGVSGDLDGIDNDGNGYVDDVVGYDFVSVSAGSVAAGEDPGPRDNNPMDVLGHGTHCAGIAAAVMNNSIGIAGVAPSCKIMPVRAGYKGPDGNGYLEDFDIQEALLYAIDNGARVISMSWGGYDLGAWEDEIRTAYSENIVLVAAAGNDGVSDEMYPAAMDEVIAVAATDSNDFRASFSNYGDWIDVAAPGVGILSTLPNNQYASWSGTSMATPHVSGLAALIASLQPGYSNEEIRAVIRANTADLGDEGFDTIFGYGRINAYKAVKSSDLVVYLTAPAAFSNVSMSTVSVTGSAYGADFSHYTLEYKCKGAASYSLLTSDSDQVIDAELYQWDLTTIASALTSNTICLKLTAFDNAGNSSSVIYVINCKVVDFVFPKTFIPSDTSLPSTYAVEEVLGPGNYDIRAKNQYQDVQYKLKYKYDDEPTWTFVMMSSLKDASGEIHFNPFNILSLPRIDNRHLKLGIFHPTTDVEMAEEEVIVDPLLKAGWPTKLTYEADYPFPYKYAKALQPVVVDLSGDGQKEIFYQQSTQNTSLPAGADWQTKLYLLDNSGNILPGWPIDFFVSGDRLSPAAYPVCDFDGTGNNEIVVAKKSPAGDFEILGLSYSGAVRTIAQFSIPDLTNNFTSGPPSVTVSDINNDGNAEIILSVLDGPAGVIVLDKSGNFLPGWPVKNANQYGYTMPALFSPPVVGDINGDGFKEIAVIWPSQTFSSTDQRYFLHVFDYQGHELSGWPKNLGNLLEGGESVIFADMDGNGTKEIICGYSTMVEAGNFGFIGDSVISVWNADGTDFEAGVGTPWPKVFPGYPSALPKQHMHTIVSDINNDTLPEIIYTQYNQETNALENYVFKNDGTPMGQVSFGSGVYSAVTAAGDINNDGYVEKAICLSDHFAIYGSGGPIFNRLTGGGIQFNGDNGSPVILDDIDNDGVVEAVTGDVHERIWIWKTGYIKMGDLEWPMYCHDSQQTDCYEKPSLKNSKNIITADLDANGADEVIFNLGAGKGVWVRYDTGSLAQLNGLSPKSMAKGNVDGNNKDDLVMDFGFGRGIWVRYDNGTWTNIQGLTAKKIITGDIDGDGKDEIIADFGSSYGIWVYKTGAWTNIHGMTPRSMVAADINGDNKDELIMDFGPSYGIWVRNSSGMWSNIQGLSSKSMISADINGDSKDELIVDFGPSRGIWAYDNTAWSNICGITSNSIAKGDVDGDNKDELVIDFGAGKGIWIRDDTGAWANIYGISPKIIVTGDINGNNKDDLIIDFGSPKGTWVRYDDGTWAQLMG